MAEKQQKKAAKNWTALEMTGDNGDFCGRRKVHTEPEKRNSMKKANN